MWCRKGLRRCEIPLLEFLRRGVLAMVVDVRCGTWDVVEIEVEVEVEVEV